MASAPRSPRGSMRRRSITSTRRSPGSGRPRSRLPTTSGWRRKMGVPEGESGPIGAVIAEIGGDAGAAPKAEKTAEPKEKAEKPAEPQGRAPAAATRPEAHVEQADKAMAKTAQQAAESGG